MHANAEGRPERANGAAVCLLRRHLRLLQKTYGSLGGVIVFLVWLWITNIAILFGAEFNAELQRSQQREAGERAPLGEPLLEPRDTSKLEKKEKK